MKLQHPATKTTIQTDDAAKIAKLKTAGYEVVSEESAAESRTKELKAMSRKDLDEIAVAKGLKPIEYTSIQKIVDAILEAESNAGSA